MVVFAHGSGIDDVLWFLVPVVLALFVLKRAERRAAKSNREPLLRSSRNLDQHLDTGF